MFEWNDGSYLVHYGIPGQKWGLRRFQNEDGSLTAAGRDRYGVADGSRKPSAVNPLSTKAGKTNNSARPKNGLSKKTVSPFGPKPHQYKGQVVISKPSGGGVGFQINADTSKLDEELKEHYIEYTAEKDKNKEIAEFLDKYKNGKPLGESYKFLFQKWHIPEFIKKFAKKLFRKKPKMSTNKPSNVKPFVMEK